MYRGPALFILILCKFRKQESPFLVSFHLYTRRLGMDIRRFELGTLIFLMLIFIASNASATKSKKVWVKNSTPIGTHQLDRTQHTQDLNVSIEMICYPKLIITPPEPDGTSVGVTIYGKWITPTVPEGRSNNSDWTRILIHKFEFMKCNSTKKHVFRVTIPDAPQDYQPGDLYHLKVCAADPLPVLENEWYSPCDDVLTRVDLSSQLKPDLELEHRNMFKKIESTCSLRNTTIIRNTGTITAKSFPLSWEWKHNGAWKKLVEKQIGGINAGENRRISHDFPIGVTGGLNYENCRQEDDKVVCDPILLKVCANRQDSSAQEEFSLENNCQEYRLNNTPLWDTTPDSCPDLTALSNLKLPIHGGIQTNTGNRPFLNPFINVTSPALNEQWCIGDTKQILWRRFGNMSDTVRIRLMPIDERIENNVTNNGSFPWPITNNYEPGTYFIRIITSRTPRISADSDEFQLVECP